MGEIFKTPLLFTAKDYMGEALARSYADYASSTEGMKLQGYKRLMKGKMKATGGGGMKPFYETVWVDENGNEVALLGPTTEELYEAYMANNPYKRDAGDVNWDLFGLVTGTRGLGMLANGARWLWSPTGRNLVGSIALGEAAHQTANLVNKGLGGSGDYMGDAFNFLGGNNISNPYLRTVADFGFRLFDPTYLIGGAYARPFGNKLASIDWGNVGKSAYNTGQNIYNWGVRNIGYNKGLGILFGNYYYKIDPNTMSLNVPSIQRTAVYTPSNLPGLQIKSLMIGSPLERLVSPKNGTISVKQLQAYIGRNDVPAHDKYLILLVLDNHIGETHLDYNTLRKEVQELIPTYEKVLLTEFSDYGMNRLGFTENKETLIGMFSEDDFLKEPSYFDARLNTFTFESPGIEGNTKHYTGNPVGHSRTYTTIEEPDVLHVMESLSDWALSGGASRKQDAIKWDIEFLKNALADWDAGIFRFGPREVLEQQIINLTKLLEGHNLTPVLSRMVNSYTQRQIQENLRYAASQGQTKMRYPTAETAAKIEGYKPSLLYNFDDTIFEALNKNILKNNLDSDLRFLLDTLYSNYVKLLLDKNISNESILLSINYGKPINYDLETIQLLDKLRNSLTELKYYEPLYQTILRKYANFPKEYNKLFKGAEVRTVTDSKGNTWYEVDVPQNYIDNTAEIIFHQGGKLIPKSKFLID